MGEMYNQRAKASKTLDLSSVPNLIVAGSNSPVKVGKGKLCRIKGTAGGFVRFAKAGDVTVPDATTKETFETEARYFYLISTEDFIITSAAMRVEVTND